MESPQKKPTKSVQCFGCKTKVEIDEYEIKITINNHRRIAGKCCQCGHKVSSFIADDGTAPDSKPEEKVHDASQTAEPSDHSDADKSH